MNATLDTVSQNALSALLEFVGHVEQMYSAAAVELSTPGPKALAGFLAIQHAEHVEDFRDLASKFGISHLRPEATDSATHAAWEEIRIAITSDKRDVVLAACQLTERMVLRVYRLVTGRLTANRRVLDMVNRHLRELHATEAFVRTMCSDDVSWMSDTHAGPGALLSDLRQTRSAGGTFSPRALSENSSATRQLA